MMPSVTLAVATLNRPDYLQETLSSVMAQDYPNLDILVSDNGSRDETPALAQSLLKDERRARFRRNHTTAPQHAHFTQCLREARGEFFILLSDDDWISPNFVSALVSVATRYPDVTVVVPSNATIDECGEVIEEFAKPPNDVFDGFEFVSNWLYCRPPRLFVNVVTVLLRTETISRFGGYQDLAGGRNVDNLLFLQCALSGRVGFSREALFRWRAYGGSYGAASTPHQVSECSRQFLQHLESDPPTVKVLAALSNAERAHIISGVRTMTANELIYCIMANEDILNWKTFLKMCTLRRDRAFWHAALREYYRRFRKLLK